MKKRICTKCDYFMSTPEGDFCLEKQRVCTKHEYAEICNKYTRTDLRWRCENFDKEKKICKKSGTRCAFINNCGDCADYVNATRYGLDRVQEHYRRFEKLEQE